MFLEIDAIPAFDVCRVVSVICELLRRILWICHPINIPIMNSMEIFPQQKNPLCSLNRTTHFDGNFFLKLRGIN